MRFCQPEASTRVAWKWSQHLLAALLVFCACGGLFFRRNDDLRLLQPSTGYSVLYPTWSPDGKSIYVLLDERALPSGGQLWTIRPDGSGERLLLRGLFGSLAISPNGTRLAIVAVTTGARYIGGLLLLVDTSGTVLDTLSSPSDIVSSVHFGGTNDTLYYSVNERGIFRLDLRSGKSDTVSLVSLNYRQDFDVSGDSLLALPGAVCQIPSGRRDSLPLLWQPRFNPSDPSIVLGALEGSSGFLSDLVSVDRNSGSVMSLRANPYYDSDIMNPCWSPNARKVALSAEEVVHPLFDIPERVGQYRLWILNL
jgi:Tol biopolymer transport system component